MTSAVLMGEKAVRMGLEEAFNDRAASAAGASLNWLALPLLAEAPVLLTTLAFSWRSSPLQDYALTSPVFSVLDSIDEWLFWRHEQRWPPPRPCSLRLMLPL